MPTTLASGYLMKRGAGYGQGGSFLRGAGLKRRWFEIVYDENLHAAHLVYFDGRPKSPEEMHSLRKGIIDLSKVIKHNFGAPELGSLDSVRADGIQSEENNREFVMEVEGGRTFYLVDSCVAEDPSSGASPDWADVLDQTIRAVKDTSCSSSSADLASKGESSESSTSLGWGEKLGKSQHAWRRRFFVLDAKCLRYHREAIVATRNALSVDGGVTIEREERGSIRLLDVEGIYLAEMRGQLPTLEIITNTRIWKVRPASDAKKWMSSIKSAVETSRRSNDSESNAQDYNLELECKVRFCVQKITQLPKSLSGRNLKAMCRLGNLERVTSTIKAEQDQHMLWNLRFGETFVLPVTPQAATRGTPLQVILVEERGSFRENKVVSTTEIAMRVLLGCATPIPIKPVLRYSPEFESSDKSHGPSVVLMSIQALRAQKPKEVVVSEDTHKTLIKSPTALLQALSSSGSSIKTRMSVRQKSNGGIVCKQSDGFDPSVLVVEGGTDGNDQSLFQPLKGKLEKRSKQGKGKWQSRFFECRGRWLVYFKNDVAGDNGCEPLAAIDLQRVVVFYDESKPNVVALSSKHMPDDLSVFLRARTVPLARKWEQGLRLRVAHLEPE